MLVFRKNAEKNASTIEKGLLVSLTLKWWPARNSVGGQSESGRAQHPSRTMSVTRLETLNLSLPLPDSDWCSSFINHTSNSAANRFVCNTCKLAGESSLLVSQKLSVFSQ